MTGAISTLALVVAVSCLGTAVLVGAQTVTARYRWSGTVSRLGVVEGLVVLLAVVDIVSLVSGHRPRELATHVAYLPVSVLVVPAAITQVRDDDGRWAGALVALSLLVVVVIVVRQLTTWRAGG